MFFSCFFLFSVPLSPISTLFPYTTLFRSAYSSLSMAYGGDYYLDYVIWTEPLPGEPYVHPIDESRDKIKGDRKSTRLNSSHVAISYAVFCLKKNNYFGCVFNF